MDVLTNFKKFQEMLSYLKGLSPKCKYPDVGDLQEKVVLVGSSLMSLKIPVSKDECRKVLDVFNKINDHITFEIAGSPSISPERTSHQILILHISELEKNI